ncbi:MAG: hypothetical protein ABIU05_22595, partial [Nitrospirales bacterium]
MNFKQFRRPANEHSRTAIAGGRRPWPSAHVEDRAAGDSLRPAGTLVGPSDTERIVTHDLYGVLATG